KAGRFHAGRAHVFAQRVLPPNVLHERAALASHGGAHVVIPIDPRGRLAGDIALATRGVVDEKRDAHILAAARREAAAAVDELADGWTGGAVDEPALSEAARQ